MVARSSTFDTAPNACPFIALELDRDRRSERPDYRHRCYAEQVPAPRTIAHQERYCLSPNFAGCPIFQDWALRAAARPVPLPQGYEGRRGPADARAAAAAAAAVGAASAADEPEWPDSMDAASAAAAAAAAGVDEGSGTQQLGAFDAPPPAAAPLSEPEAEPLVESMPAPEPHASPAFDDEDADADEGLRPAAVVAAAAIAGSEEPLPPAEPELAPSTASPDDEPDAIDGVAPVPAFLAARSARPQSAPPQVDERISREEVVPSWELTDRYGAQSGGRPESGSSGDGTFSKILTAVAVIIILALGIAAVVLVPGLLNGPGAAATPRTSLALASRSPTTTSVAGVATPTATSAAPTATPDPTPDVTPGTTPRSYRVKPGDTLAKIAKRFDITVDELRAVNPAIADTDHIEVRQILIIPLPAS